MPTSDIGIANSEDQHRLCRFWRAGNYLQRAVAPQPRECQAARQTAGCAAWAAKEPPMIGVALAQWLLDQDRHDRLGDTLGGEAELFEQLPRGGGLAEAIDSDDGPRAANVLVPEVGRPSLDSDAR